MVWSASCPGFVAGCLVSILCCIREWCLMRICVSYEVVMQCVVRVM